MASVTAPIASSSREEPTSAAEMRDHAPLVSIVVVSYNYERYVGAAVESALSQTYARIQVLVVDDGSTDGSREILSRYADRARLVLKTNKGETSAANAGFAASLGDIVLFLDSDDVLYETAVEEVVAAWRPGVAKVQFRLDVIDAGGTSFGYATPAGAPNLSPMAIRERVLHYGFYPTPPSSGNAYARTFLTRVMPLDTGVFPFSPDGALNTIAPLYGDVISLDRILGCYRVHGRNMWIATDLDRDKILGKIALSRVQVAFLRRHAGLLGIRLDCENPSDRSFFLLEQRLAAVKIAPGHTLVADDKPLKLFWLACQCIAIDEPSYFRVGVKLAWFFITAISPSTLARTLLEYRHRGYRRHRFAKWFRQIPQEVSSPERQRNGVS